MFNQKTILEWSIVIGSSLKSQTSQANFTMLQITFQAITKKWLDFHIKRF